jgi:uncharacterized protein (TIGR02246 family)
MLSKDTMARFTSAPALALLCAIAFVSCMNAQTSTEAQVRQTVQAFYTAFNSDGFARGVDFTTEDWNHINPFGGWTKGRVAVLKEVLEVHNTFLKGVTDTVRQMDIRMASSDVAVATVTSDLSSFTTPEGVTHEGDRQIRTFIVVKRGGRWLIMQDHNTFVVAQPGSSR